MDKKIIEFGTTARKNLSVGVEVLGKAVGSTLGPCGRNIMIERPGSLPLITKDGVTVAHSIELKDKMANIGSSLVKVVSEETAMLSGDGTTTATILSEAMIMNGLKYLVAGADPMRIKAGMDMAVSFVIQELERLSSPVDIEYNKPYSDTQIGRIATISSNGDKEMGSLVAEVVTTIGSEGVISVENSTGFETYYEINTGLELNRGYKSPYFVTSTDTSECILEDEEQVYVFVYRGKLLSMKKLVGYLDQISDLGKPVLVIATDIDGDALNMLILNKQKADFKVCAVKAPGFGEKQDDALDDIAACTGARVINPLIDDDIVSISDFGRCRKAIIDQNKTVIFDGMGEEDQIIEQVCKIEHQMKHGAADVADYYRQRSASLVSGMAVIKVGAHTEVELMERKARLEDALNAVSSAIDEGVLPGGGTAYAKCISKLETLKLSDVDKQMGINLIRRALSVPIRKISNNAGIDGEVVLNKVMNNHSDSFYGYNAATGVYGNMMDMGVIDPTKVSKTALQKAASVAAIFLTTEAVIRIK